jgi:hypothetical protein
MAYTGRMRLRAFVLMLLLLLPSSVGAAVTVAQNCADLQAQGEMECCCRHAEENTSQHQGATMAPKCCCEAEAPASPIEAPKVPRLAPEPIPDWDWTAAFAADVLAPAKCVTQVQGISLHPPRAPPWSTLQRSQRFLI